MANEQSIQFLLFTFGSRKFAFSKIVQTHVYQLFRVLPVTIRRTFLKQETDAHSVSMA